MHGKNKKSNLLEPDSFRKYLNNDCLNQQNELEQNEFIRLKTFEGKNIKLSKFILAQKGFFCNQNTLRCSSCSFKSNDLNVDSLYRLFSDHLKYIEKNSKCIYYDIQNEFIRCIIKDKKTDEGLIKRKEKFPKQFEKFESRLATFDPNLKLEINVRDLAENGMCLVEDTFLCQSAKKLMCFFCNYECYIFTKGHLNNYYEKPVIDHEKKSPDCEIVRKKNENKTEIDGLQGENIFLSLKNESDTIAPIQYNINGNSNFDLVKRIIHKSANASCDKPYHPGYATEQSRLDSFREWPTNLIQQPNELSKAGFYYYGLKDMVKCFYCNGGLRNWDPIDEPIIEHARWFPRCSYIRQLKGVDFIEQVRERYKDLDNGFKDDYDDSLEYYDVVNNETSNIDTKNNSGSIKKRSISPRTINSRMDLPSIKKIIELGIPRNTIKQVIETKLSESNSDFESCIDLVKACYKMKESSKNVEKQFQDAYHLYISNITMDVTYKGVCDEFRKNFSVTPVLIK